MTASNPILTLDANIVLAALRMPEPGSEKCVKILERASNEFVLAEPSIIYQEVCGTLSRKSNLERASNARDMLDLYIQPQRLVSCDRETCISASSLCSQHKIYSVDALYLYVAIVYGAVLVSLDKEFINGLNRNKLPIDAYTVETFPY